MMTIVFVLAQQYQISINDEQIYNRIMNLEPLNRKITIEVKALVRQLMKSAQIPNSNLDEQITLGYLPLAEQLMAEGTSLDQNYQKKHQRDCIQKKRSHTGHHSASFKKDLIEKITQQQKRGFSLGSVLTYYAEQFQLSKRTLQRWMNMPVLEEDGLKKQAKRRKKKQLEMQSKKMVKISKQTCKLALQEAYEPNQFVQIYLQLDKQASSIKEVQQSYQTQLKCSSSDEDYYKFSSIYRQEDRREPRQDKIFFYFGQQDSV